MSTQFAVDEYAQALRKGQKEYRELLMAGLPTHPAVLEALLPDIDKEQQQSLGVLEIPAERIIGTKTAGRITAFTPTFRPLLDGKSEFAWKWISLCQAHLNEAGIRDPVEVYEYLGNFYVQEGNKRVSVLRHFDATRITANVTRILPEKTEAPRIRAYYEFLEFFKKTRLYTVQFRRPGDYGKLLTLLGKTGPEPWTEEERRNFSSGYHYFTDAFAALEPKGFGVLPEEALLLWLELYPFRDLLELTPAQLKKTLFALREDLQAVSRDAVKLQTRPTEHIHFLSRILLPDHLNIAFIHQLNPGKSTWVMSHEEGRAYVERLFGDRITARSYFDANTPEQAAAVIDQAVAEGTHVVFTTAPAFRRVTLRAAVTYPKIRFFNCSVDQPYSSIRTYYARIYEAKFITGAIAGAMAGNDRIGYITSYPIFGVPASINAFALGAQMTNPRAQVELKWSCLPGTPQADLFADGIRVISNRSAPVDSRMYLDFCSYGTYLMDDRGDLVPLGTPLWVWGKFYAFALRNIFSGGWNREKEAGTALNYWLGMDSGVISVKLSDKLPEGVRRLAKLLQRGMTDGTIDPFFRKITAQDGTVKNDGSRTFTPEQLLHMDWLCDNVVGSIPAFSELLPGAQPLVRELGIYRDVLDKEEIR